MSRNPNRLGLFDDVKEILDAALAAGGGTYTCLTYGAAVHWRQRAYRFRKLYAEIHGVKNSSVYDKLTMPRVVEGDTVVHIITRQHTGVFTPNNQPAPTPLIEDDLFNEAADLARRLSGDIL